MLEGLLDPLRWEMTFSQMDTLWQGFAFTLQVVVAGLLLSIVLGTILGVFSTTRSRVLRAISRVFVEFYQNTPLPVQVFFMYAAGPKILQALTGASSAVRIAPFVLGFVGVGLYHAAYISEVIRPQTFRVILPPLCNQALNLVKNTSVLALIAGGDLMYNADNFVSTYGYLQGYIMCCLLYFIICFPLALLVQWLEKRSKERPRAKVIPGITPEPTKEA